MLIYLSDYLNNFRMVLKAFQLRQLFTDSLVIKPEIMIQRMEGYKFMFLNGTVSMSNFGIFLTVKSSPKICLILGVLFRVM